MEEAIEQPIEGVEVEDEDGVVENEGGVVEEEDGGDDEEDREDTGEVTGLQEEEAWLRAVESGNLQQVFIHIPFLSIHSCPAPHPLHPCSGCVPTSSNH